MQEVVDCDLEGRGRGRDTEMPMSLGCVRSQVRMCQLMERGGHGMGLGAVGWRYPASLAHGGGVQGKDNCLISDLPCGTEIFLQAIRLALERKRLLVSMTMNRGCISASPALAEVGTWGGRLVVRLCAVRAVGHGGWGAPAGV